MTEKDVAKIESALLRRLKPWVGRSSHLIAEKVRDARAHADKALSETLKNTPDGRATAAKIQRSPSYQAANRRLGELKTDVIALIRDARAEFYRGSVDLWLPFIPERFRSVRDPVPTSKGEALMRGAIIHGYTLEQEIQPGVEQAKTRLAVALNAAARRRLRSEVATDLLDLWRTDTTNQLTARAISALSDSDSAIHQTVGLIVIKDEYRGDVFPAIHGAV